MVQLHSLQLQSTITSVHALKSPSSSSIAMLVNFSQSGACSVTIVDLARKTAMCAGYVDYYACARASAIGGDVGGHVEDATIVDWGGKCAFVVVNGGSRGVAFDINVGKCGSSHLAGEDFMENDDDDDEDGSVGYGNVIENTFDVDFRELLYRHQSKNQPAAAAIVQPQSSNPINSQPNKRVGVAGKSCMSTGLGDVISSCFLSRYNQPTIAMLHAPRGRTWSGRASQRKCPMCVTAVTVSVKQKRAVVLWTCDVLPNDCFYMVGCPARVTAGRSSTGIQKFYKFNKQAREASEQGGKSGSGSVGGSALVFSSNSIHYVLPGGIIGYSLSCNGYSLSSLSGPYLFPRRFVSHPHYKSQSSASSSTLSGSVSRRRLTSYGFDVKACKHAPLKCNARPLAKLNVTLSGCSCAFVSSTCAVIALKSGAVYALDLHVGMDGSVSEVTCSDTKYDLGSCYSGIVPIGFEGGVGFHDDRQNFKLQEEGYSVSVVGGGKIFAFGSVGDSALIEYELRSIASEKTGQQGEERGEKGDSDGLDKEVVDEEERILRMEEDELFQVSLCQLCFAFFFFIFIFFFFYLLLSLIYFRSASIVDLTLPQIII